MLQYIPFIGDMVSRFFGSKEKRDQYQADARSAVYSQFANEFGHSRTWWDSLIDGLNRLPRPFMTFGTIYLFWLCWYDPVEFVRGAEALQAMPNEGWYILGAIVTFWFAAKLPKDFGKMKGNKDIAEIAARVAEKRIEQTGNADPENLDIEWTQEVKPRYERRTDWDNLNN